VNRPGEWLRERQGLVEHIDRNEGWKSLVGRTGRSMYRGDTKTRCLWTYHTSPRAAIFLGRSECRTEQKSGKPIASWWWTPWWSSWHLHSELADGRTQSGDGGAITCTTSGLSATPEWQENFHEPVHIFMMNLSLIAAKRSCIVRGQLF
jgi:hypothetical protein